MNLINFIESFPDEASCRKKFKEIRNTEGVVCRKCGGKDHYWLATMGLRDRNYPINKIVELDEGFFESVDTEKEKEKKKRGRGSQKQSTVMVMASTIHVFNTRKKHNKPTKFRYVRMLVVDNLKGQTVEKKLRKTLALIQL